MLVKEAFRYFASNALREADPFGPVYVVVDNHKLLSPHVFWKMLWSGGYGADD